MQVAQARPSEVGPARGQRREGDARLLRAVVCVADRADHPRREREVLLLAGDRGVQVVEELGEAQMALGEPVVLGLKRRGEPRELLIGREVAVADHGRRGTSKSTGRSAPAGSVVWHTDW